MNRGIFDVRLAAVLLVFLVGSVSLISVNQRAEANGAMNALCSSCSSSSSAPQVLDTTVLKGEDKNKAIATALSSEDYKNVKKLFPTSIYEPLIPNATAAIINLELNGTKYEASAVFVPFEVGASFSAGIIFVTIEGHTVAIGVMADLQYKIPVFSAMSVDGKATVIPLKRSASCRSCSTSGSGVSPMDVTCFSVDDCIYFYGVGYCCVSNQCVWCGIPSEPSEDCSYCHWIYNVAQQIGCLEVGIILIIACSFVCWLFPSLCATCWGATLVIIVHVCAEIALGHCADEACAYYCVP